MRLLSRLPGFGSAGTAAGWFSHDSNQPWGQGPESLRSSLPAEEGTEGVVLLDLRGLVTEANESALELLQCSLAAIEGRDFWETVPEAVAEQHQSATGKALSSASRHAFVANHQFENRWIEYTFRRRVAGYSVYLRDVASTQKLLRMLDDSERAHQLIFESNPTPMWIVGLTSQTVVAANQAAADFYGMPRKKMVNLPVLELFPEGEALALLNSLTPGPGTKDEPVDLRICKQVKADGQLVLVELACGWVNWRGQRAILASLADVTERHLADTTLRRINAELERDLNGQRAELEATQQDLAALTRAISHDLRGPLHVANGFATTLAEKYASVLDTQGLHYAMRIQASTRQLATLVDDLRNLVQLAHLQVKLEPIDIAALCRPLVESLRKRSPGRQVSFETEANLPITGDRYLLTIALGCLLDNAWKFTAKRDQAWVQVAVIPGAAPDEVVLQVSDNGAGFDAAYSSKLFTPFHRLHSSTEFAGSGLGLAIVKGVATRHGGRVWAETEAQGGARFLMSLPQGGGGEGSGA